MKLGIATASSPLGPFTNDAESFLMDKRAIDSHADKMTKKHPARVLFAR